MEWRQRGDSGLVVLLPLEEEETLPSPHNSHTYIDPALQVPQEMDLPHVLQEVFKKRSENNELAELNIQTSASEATLQT